MPHPWRVARGTKVSCYSGFKFSELNETHAAIDRRWRDNWQCGLVTSLASGILAADVDDLNAFRSWGVDLPKTAYSRTGREQGYHLLFDGRDVEDWPTQGNMPGGQIKSNGFIGVEPSIHPNGNMYQWGERYVIRSGRVFCEAVLDWRESNGSSSARYDIDELLANGMDPEQHHATLAGVILKLRREGWGQEDIFPTCLDIINARPKKGCKCRNRSVLLELWAGADALVSKDERELDGLSEAVAKHIREQRQGNGSGLVQSLAGMKREMVQWLWPGYLAFHELTQMDGEKGQGKTFITDDVTARATLGLAMPGYGNAVCGPVNVLILTDEGHAESTILPRLEAAGADLDRVFIPKVEVKRGRAPQLLLLPGAARLVGEMIAACNNGEGAGLVIWDPITDFLGENIQSHNDASVRRALRPMGIELHRHMCAGLALRHMNQNKNQDAKYRGSGSGAFQNRARVHLVTGPMPIGFRGKGGKGQYGLAMVDNNIMPKVRGSLAYSIVDSDIQGDDQGNMVGRVEWHGLVDVDANTLTRGESARLGPEPVAQNKIIGVLEEMFEQKDTWPQNEVIARLKDEGCSTNKVTLDKAKSAMGIRSVPEHRPGGGYAKWVWTTKKLRVRRGGDGNDD
jgi:hypothetical protein